EADEVRINCEALDGNQGRHVRAAMFSNHQIRAFRLHTWKDAQMQIAQLYVTVHPLRKRRDNPVPHRIGRQRDGGDEHDEQDDEAGREPRHDPEPPLRMLHGEQFSTGRASSMSYTEPDCPSPQSILTVQWRCTRFHSTRPRATPTSVAAGGT